MYTSCSAIGIVIVVLLIGTKYNITLYRYSDSIIPRIARAAVELTDDSLADIMQDLGLHFLLLLSSLVYRRVCY